MPVRNFTAYIIFAILLCNFTSVLSQSATIRGIVYEKESGEPVIFTNVYLEGTTFGTSTNVDGYYALSKIPAGTYTLISTSLGFDTARVEITVKKDAVISQNLYLEKKAVDIATVEVSSEKVEAQSEVKMSVVKVTPKEINQIPTIGGDADLAQYIQVLPGVVFTGDQGGQLYIRGGSPIQNKVMLDGMIIYNPFHTIGLFSVFETDIIRNADIYTGGFNAEYGGRISSVMDIRTKDGNKKSISGNIGASVFGAKAVLEGPLKKQVNGSGSVSFIAAAKTSYLDRTSPILYSYIDTAGLPFNYTDMYGKISFNAKNGSKINLFGFNFRDQVTWQSISDLNWNTWGAGTNFVLIPGNNPVLIDGNFSYSQYEIGLDEANDNSRESSIDGFNLGLNFTYFQGKNEVKYGLEILGFSTDFRFQNEFNRTIEQQAFTTELSGFLKYKINAGKLVIEPSFRAQYYASLATFSPEPRLGIKYNINDDVRFKLAAGIYSQNLISANSDRDVVNLFSGFLSGPENLQDTVYYENGNNRLRKHELQKANHLIGGFEIDLTNNINVNIEGYYKQFNQITNINRNKIFEDNSENASKPDLLKKDFVIETGDAYGVDLVLKYDHKRWYLWAVYSLGKVNRFDGITAYAPIFDRRHNVNLLGTYILGKNLDWEISARWNLGTGLPFTQTQGFYEEFTFSGGIDDDYTTNNGQLGINYGQLNNGRLPTYHRFDVSVKKIFHITTSSKIEATVSVTNVYDRNNIFYFDRIKFERVDQLPVLPSLGVNWRF